MKHLITTLAVVVAALAAACTPKTNTTPTPIPTMYPTDYPPLQGFQTPYPGSSGTPYPGSGYVTPYPGSGYVTPYPGSGYVTPYPGTGYVTPYPGSSGQGTYTTRFQSVIQNYCGPCHSGYNPRGRVDLSNLNNVRTYAASMASRIQAGNMPQYNPSMPQINPATFQQTPDGQALLMWLRSGNIQ